MGCLIIPITKVSPEAFNKEFNKVKVSETKYPGYTESSLFIHANAIFGEDIAKKIYGLNRLMFESSDPESLFGSRVLKLLKKDTNLEEYTFESLLELITAIPNGYALVGFSSKKELLNTISNSNKTAELDLNEKLKNITSFTGVKVLLYNEFYSNKAPKRGLLKYFCPIIIHSSSSYSIKLIPNTAKNRKRSKDSLLGECAKDKLIAILSQALQNSSSADVEKLETIDEVKDLIEVLSGNNLNNQDLSEKTLAQAVRLLMSLDKLDAIIRLKQCFPIPYSNNLEDIDPKKGLYNDLIKNDITEDEKSLLKELWEKKNEGDNRNKLQTLYSEIYLRQIIKEGDKALSFSKRNIWSKIVKFFKGIFADSKEVLLDSVRREVDNLLDSVSRGAVDLDLSITPNIDAKLAVLTVSKISEILNLPDAVKENVGFMNLNTAYQEYSDSVMHDSSLSYQAKDNRLKTIKVCYDTFLDDCANEHVTKTEDLAIKKEALRLSNLLLTQASEYINGASSAISSMQPDAKSREYSLALKRLNDAEVLLCIIKNLESTINSIGHEMDSNFEEDFERLKKEKGRLITKLDSLLRSGVAKWLIAHYGTDEIDLEDYLETSGLFATPTKTIKKQGKGTIHFSDLLLQATPDTLSGNTIAALIVSPSVSRDVLLNMAHDIYKTALLDADKKSEATTEHILNLRKECLDKGLKPEDFYEYNANGVPTGYLITPIDYRKLNRDKRLFPEGTKLSEMYVMHKGERQPMYVSSSSFLLNAPLVPNPEVYSNSDFYKIFDTEEKKKLYNEVMEIKSTSDKLIFGSNLPNDATIHRKAPQYRSFSHRSELYTRNLSEKNWVKNAAKTVWTRIKQTWIITSDDADFATPNISMLEQEDEVPIFNIPGAIRNTAQIPMYGVQSLKNREQLNTDIFGSLICYNTHCNEYRAKYDIGGVLLGMKSLAAKRTVITDANTVDAKGIKNIANSIKSIIRNAAKKESAPWESFIKTKFYNNKLSGNMIFDSLRKGFFSTFGKMASYMFLAGNTLGALVNLFVGVYTALQAALSGELSFKTFFKALNYAFFIGGYTEIANLGRQKAKSNMDYFMYRYNARTQNTQRKTSYDSRQTRFGKFIFNDMAFWGYGAGDRLMQFISAASIADSTVVYDVDGNKTTIAELTIYNPSEEYRKTKGKVLNKENVKYYKVPKPKEIIEYNHNIEKTFKYLIEAIKAKNLIPSQSLGKEDVIDMLKDILNKYDMKSVKERYGDNIEQLSKDLINFWKYTFPIPINAENSITILTQMFNYCNNILSRATLEEYIENSINEASDYQRRNIEWNYTDDIRLSNIMRQTNFTLYGSYNREDYPAIQELAGWTAFTQMKGFVFAYLEKRFSRPYHSINSAKIVLDKIEQDVEEAERAILKIPHMEGMYLTFWKCLISAIKSGNPKKFGVLFLASFGVKNWPNEELSQRQMTNLAFVAHDFANIFFATVLLPMLTEALESDDEDKDGDWGEQLLLLLLYRITYESSVFHPFSISEEGWYTMFSPLLLLQPLETLGDLSYEVFKYIANKDKFADVNFGDDNEEDLQKCYTLNFDSIFNNISIGEDIKMVFDNLYRNIDGLNIKREIDLETGDIKESKKWVYDDNDNLYFKGTKKGLNTNEIQAICRSYGLYDDKINDIDAIKSLPDTEFSDLKEVIETLDGAIRFHHELYKDLYFTQEVTGRHKKGDARIFDFLKKICPIYKTPRQFANPKATKEGTQYMNEAKTGDVKN